jgi:hypothetical protein
MILTQKQSLLGRLREHNQRKCLDTRVKATTAGMRVDMEANKAMETTTEETMVIRRYLSSDTELGCTINSLHSLHPNSMADMITMADQVRAGRHISSNRTF